MCSINNHIKTWWNDEHNDKFIDDNDVFDVIDDDDVDYDDDDAADVDDDDDDVEAVDDDEDDDGKISNVALNDGGATNVSLCSWKSRNCAAVIPILTCPVTGWMVDWMPAVLNSETPFLISVRVVEVSGSIARNVAAAADTVDFFAGRTLLGTAAEVAGAGASAPATAKMQRWS